MKIISLSAENVKKLVAVEITPEGNLVQITGKNGQGKTSVLDSIWWAIAGLANVQGKPIRDGAEEAYIRLDMGDIIITRKFKAKEEGFSSSLAVENREGAAFKSPQAMLDGLLGALAFDPLAFSRMDAKGKFNELRKFVPNVDFDAIDAANKLDYDERTVMNRQAKDEKTSAERIVINHAPVDRIDDAALISQLATAAKHNADIEIRKAKRKALADKIAEQDASAKAFRDEALRLEKLATESENEADAGRAKLQAAPELPSPIDVSKLEAKIAEAKKVNEQADKIAERKERLAKAAEFQSVADTLSANIEKRNQDKNAAIAKANMPVKGITFGESAINLNGVPFEQASDAEQLKASIAIAMAANPTLRVIRVRDGSLLDDDSMKILSQMADKNDYQVWIERVDGSGKIGFVLEAGQIKSQVKKEIVHEHSEL